MSSPEHVCNLRERLATIERTIDNGAYVPGAWQRLIDDLRHVPPGMHAAVADDVSRISRKLHLRQRRCTVSVTAGLCLECFAATLGGILLALGIPRASNALAILAMILWVSSFQPLVKVASGTALGIRYAYAYLLGSIEPRFKTHFGSYLTLPAWKRMIFHLSGTIGSPLGAALVAVTADERLPIAALVSWIVFWIVIAINAAAVLGGFAGVRRIRGFRIAETSGGVAAIELRTVIRGAH